MFASLEIGRVFVTEPVAVETLLGGHWTFCVRTEALPDCCVRRAMDDFEWLAEQLYADFPGCVAPALPEEYNALFEDNRRAALESFLCRVAAHSTLRTSPKLEAFLLGNAASFASLREQVALGVDLVIGTSWFNKSFSFFDSDSFDKLSRHREIDRIFEYVQRLEELAGAAVGGVTQLVRCAADVSEATAGMAHALNALGECEEGSVGADLLEAVAALNDEAGAFEVCAQSLSVDVEERLREHVRMLYSVRRAVGGREAAWTACIDAKGRVVRRRDQLSKSVLLSRLVGARGREALLAGQEQALDAALEEERAAEQRLQRVSALLVEEFDRFLAEKRADLTRVLRVHAEIQVLFARRRAQVWRELLPLLSAELPAYVSPRASPSARTVSRKLALPSAASIRDMGDTALTSASSDDSASPR